MVLHYTFPYCRGNYYDEICPSYYETDVDCEYEITEDQAYDAIEKQLKKDFPELTKGEIKKELEEVDIYDYIEYLTEYFYDEAYEAFRN